MAQRHENRTLFLLVAIFVAAMIIVCCQAAIEEQTCSAADILDTVIVKVGGSCITIKGQEETLNEEMLDWFSETMAHALLQSTTRKKYDDDDEEESFQQHRVQYILVHGAGSFGHFTAKEYGLRSQKKTTSPPPNNSNHTHLMYGVAKTRLSVQTLNHLVLSSLIQRNIPAVGISPWFGKPCPASSDDNNSSSSSFQDRLWDAVSSALESGLVPVLHGDACLYNSNNNGGAGIVGGDDLMELLNRALSNNNNKTTRAAVFVTDVQGVFTSDLNKDPNAKLVPVIQIDQQTGALLVNNNDIDASGSSHKHDVTGGIAAKLGSAIALAQMETTTVSIVQCGTVHAEHALQGKSFEIGTNVVLGN